MFTSVHFHRKNSLWTNLVQKIKNFILSLNFVPRLIQICRIQRWCSLFLFLNRIYLFWANLVPKLKIVLFLVRIPRSQWWYFIFPFSTGNTFLAKIGLKTQNCQLNLKFGTWTNSNMENLMVMFTFSVFD